VPSPHLPAGDGVRGRGRRLSPFPDQQFRNVAELPAAGYELLKNG
jgi:hypothetical protein